MELREVAAVGLHGACTRPNQLPMRREPGGSDFHSRIGIGTAMPIAVNHLQSVRT